MKYLKERHVPPRLKDYHEAVRTCIVREEIERWVKQDLVPVHEMPVVIEELIELGERLMKTTSPRINELRGQLKLLDLFQEDAHGRVVVLQRVAKVIWHAYEDVDWKIKNPIKVKALVCS